MGVLQVALTHLFCELQQVWKTQVVDDISRPHQHRAAVLLQQLEVVRMGAVPVELVEKTLRVTTTAQAATMMTTCLGFTTGSVSA